MNKPSPFSQHLIRTIRNDQGVADILYAGLCYLNKTISEMSDEDILVSSLFFSPELVRDRIGALVQNLTLVRQRDEKNRVRKK